MPLGLRQRFLNLPNYITLGRFLAIPLLIVVMLWMDDKDSAHENTNRTLSYGATLIFLVAMLSDLVDGYIARKRKIISVFGQFFDPLADKLLFLTAMIFMVELGRLPAWIVCVFLSREVIVTALRGVAIDEGIVIAASRWGKHKSALIATVTIGLLIHYPLWGVHWRSIAWVFIWPAMIFSMMSGVQYVVLFIQELRKRR